MREYRPIWLYLLALAAANLSLLLPPANPARVAGALLLIGLLPGWGWSRLLLATHPPLLRWTTAAALSFGLTTLLSLLLHYLPGPLPTWHLLAALNLSALIPLIAAKTSLPAGRFEGKRMLLHEWPLLLILLAALLLRGFNLAYSEFQGDEALAMITAAEALEGHDNALFLRSKGPAEVLLPLAMWRLTGTITEGIARLPFTVAALLAIVTIYLIGQRLHSGRLGWLAAAFFAANGFMVAFGRIVQYQALVVWFSALAFLLALEWRQRGQRRLALLSGFLLGVGLLAHYDAILALPAVGWLLISYQRSAVSRQPSANNGQQPETNRNAHFTIYNSLFTIISFAAAFLLTTLPFYLPFTLDPQANRTGEYVGGRIGDELRNNLPDFFHFTTFYSSSYYLILTGLLVLLALTGLLWRSGRGGRVIAGVSLVGVAAVIAAPHWFDFRGTRIDLSFLPFALLLAAAFLALFRRDAVARPWPWQAVIGWLAVPFLGYNFVVALGLTHIYTTVPAWSLLAALGWLQLETALPGPAASRRKWAAAALIALFALSTLFLWNAFVRHDVEYLQDYPAGNLPGYWMPYADPPEAGLFGFVHRAGWQAVGQLIDNGTLTGDYGSSEEPDVTTWYTRGAPRACDPLPEFYFLPDDLVDPVPLPLDSVDSHYANVGVVTQPNGKRLEIWQLIPASLALNALDEAALAHQFETNSTPAAFARSAQAAFPADANFGGLVRLIGFDLDTRRAYPGGRVPLTLYWQALAPIEASYQVFAHLESGSGPAAQADGVPVCWSYPTDAWRPGQIIADQRAISLPPDIPPGNYPLDVGLYLPNTFTRLDLLDEAGNPAGVSLTLAVVQIKNRE